jgi:hypothetical protein
MHLRSRFEIVIGNEVQYVGTSHGEHFVILPIRDTYGWSIPLILKR